MSGRVVAADVDGLAAAPQVLGDLLLGHRDQVGVDDGLVLELLGPAAPSAL
jgi:hypothetical protein